MMHPLLSFFLLTSFVSSLQVSVLRAQDATLLKRNDNEQQGLLPLQRQAVKPSSRRFSKRAGRKVNLIQADGNQEFVAQVTFGISSTTLQTFQLPVDTASSDTWVAGDNFVCEEYENYCDLGPLYTPSASFVPLNATLSDQYGDGRILGQFGTDTVTIAGFTVPNATVGVVSEGQWSFNKDTSGLFGLGGSMLANLWYPNASEPMHYQPLLYHMVSKGIISANFTLAFDQTGGYLGLSGLIPDVPHRDEWIITSMPPYSSSSQNSTIYGYYEIYIDSIDFYTRRNASINYSYREYMIVDSGTSASIFPDPVANAINEVWDPQPNPYDGSMPCSVSEFKQVPQLGVTIGNHTFWHDPQTLISKYPNGQCATAILGSGAGIEESLTILGTPFLMNVIAVFDIGNQVMRLTSTNPGQV